MQLKGFQRAGVTAIEHFDGRCLLADEQGLGKTAQAISYMARNRGAITPAVVVCPAIAKDHWANEIRATVGVFVEMCNGEKPPTDVPHFVPPVFVINPEILRFWVPFFLKLGVRLVVLDECQYFTNRATHRTKAAVRLCRTVPHVLALSGTPLTNRPAELWPVLNMIRPDVFRSFPEFGHTYCGARLTAYGWEFKGATNLDHLHAWLRSVCMVRRLKADVLHELPAKTRSIRLLPITDRATYAAAERDVIIWLAQNRGALAAFNANKAEKLARWTQLRQLLGRYKTPAVAAWCRDMLENIEDKLVVFCHHREMATALHADVGGFIITGETPKHLRSETVEAFQRRDTHRVIFLTGAARTAITLTAASTLAFAELFWRPGDHAQAEDRIHRIGQRNAVNIHYLVAAGTVEEPLAKMLNEKQTAIGTVLDGTPGELGGVLDELEKVLTYG